jgi:hypothetical protein
MQSATHNTSDPPDTSGQNGSNGREAKVQVAATCTRGVLLVSNCVLHQNQSHLQSKESGCSMLLMSGACLLEDDELYWRPCMGP